MFGLELQTSKNFFIDGVNDREVAWCHDSNLMKLEADETTTEGVASELEFVTAPCSTPDKAQEAVGYAAALAKELAERASKTSDWILRFEAGDRLLGGTWRKTCQLGIGDPSFVANPQGTVGIPLANLKPFIERVLGDLGDEGPGFLEDLDKMRKQSGLDFEHDKDRELIGFLTACHIFLVWATWENVPAVAVSADGIPLREYDGDMYRIFSFKDNAYLRSFPWPDKQESAFERDGVCRLVICRDSPKAQFKLLHRTDFCSMFRALPPNQQDRLLKLPVRADNVPEAVWPKAWRNRELLAFPYRADPPEPTAKENGTVKQYPPGGWPGDKVNPFV